MKEYVGTSKATKTYYYSCYELTLSESNHKDGAMGHKYTKTMWQRNSTWN